MNEIRAAAAARRVSIRELARRIDADYSALRRWLEAKRPMNIAVLYKIADVLGMSGSEIIKAGEARAKSTVDLEAYVREKTGDEQAVTELRKAITTSVDSEDTTPAHKMKGGKGSA